MFWMSESESNSDEQYACRRLLLRLPRLIPEWDEQGRHSFKEFHKRHLLLKSKVNSLDIMKLIANGYGDVESGLWITVLPDGRVYSNTRPSDAKRVGTYRDVLYIFIVDDESKQ